MARRIGRWLGGYLRETRGGAGKAFVIERRVGPHRIHVSTGCSTERAALKELERFEEDPFGYVPGGESMKAVRLTAELVLEYREHQQRKGLSVEWTDEVARCLVQWMTVIGPRDLRGLDLHRDLKPALDTWATRRPHRIKSLKGLFRWLIEERGLMKVDPAARLRVPQARPEKERRRKVVAFEDVQAVARHLKQPTRDVLHLLTATAWHLSEVRRFCEGGEVATPLHGEALAVLVVRHKSGGLVKQTILYAEHLEAARRLRERGSLPKRMTLARHMRAACDAAGVPRFGLGQMRHSVLTWAVEHGASPEEAAEFAHHRSSTTTRKHYLDLETPKVVPIRRLD